MNPTLLPISICHTLCKNCGLPTEFYMFESGIGGEFSTYIGRRTKNIYRVDISKVQYTGKELKDVLLPAADIEGGIENLASIPEQVICNICRVTFSAEVCVPDREEQVYAFQL